MATHVLRIPTTIYDLKAKKAVRDPLLETSNNGVLFAADLSFPWCYPGGDPASRPSAGAPESGAVIRDISEQNDAMFIGNDDHVTYQGGGFDFTGLQNVGVGIQIPKSVINQIYLNQQFLVCFYVKLPILENWNVSGAILPMFTAAPISRHFQNASEMVVASQKKDGYIDFRYQTEIGVTTTLNAHVGQINAYGNFTQLAFWRGLDNRFGMSARTVDGIRTASTSSEVTKNSEDYSSNNAYLGGSCSGFCGTVSPVNPEQAKGFSYRIYRAFIEDLSLSKRDPAQVIADDWARTIARKVFS